MWLPVPAVSVLGTQRQEDPESEASLGYLVRASSSQNKDKTKQRKKEREERKGRRTTSPVERQGGHCTRWFLFCQTHAVTTHHGQGVNQKGSSPECGPSGGSCVAGTCEQLT